VAKLAEQGLGAPPPQRRFHAVSPRPLHREWPYPLRLPPRHAAPCDAF
jgi:hypothetical protein